MGGMCMAKQTFLNLPEEKKNNIINALKKEFSRVPLKDALVSNIIIDAKIPRGSFYQYFDNIEDAYYYIIEEYSKDVKKNLNKENRMPIGNIKVVLGLQGCSAVVAVFCYFWG